MQDVYYTPDQTAQQQLALLGDNIKPDRSGEDILFHALLEWGIELSAAITRRSIAGHEVWCVNDDALMACFDHGIDEALVRALAQHRPLRVVFRDSGFVNDATKINVTQIFAQLSPMTDIRVL
jgi:adenine-specific DNA-methyltransferase